VAPWIQGVIKIIKTIIKSLQKQKKATKVSCGPVDPRGDKNHKNNN
jgi:hypothetical protein